MQHLFKYACTRMYYITLGCFLAAIYTYIHLSMSKSTMTVSHDHGSHETPERGSCNVHGMGLKFLVTAFAKITKTLAEYPKKAM